MLLTRFAPPFGRRSRSNPLRAPLRSALANQRPLRASSRPLHAQQSGGNLLGRSRFGSPRSPPLVVRAARRLMARAACARGNFLAFAS